MKTRKRNSRRKRRGSPRKRRERFASRIGETPESLDGAGAAVREWLKGDGRQTREGGRRPSGHEEDSEVDLSAGKHYTANRAESKPPPSSPVKTGGPLSGNKETQEPGRSVKNGRSTPGPGAQTSSSRGMTGGLKGNLEPGNGAGRRSRRQTETRREFARVLAKTSPAGSDRAEPLVSQRPEAQPTSRAIQG